MPRSDLSDLMFTAIEQVLPPNRATVGKAPNDLLEVWPSIERAPRFDRFLFHNGNRPLDIYRRKVSQSKQAPRDPDQVNIMKTLEDIFHFHLHFQCGILLSHSVPRIFV